MADREIRLIGSFKDDITPKLKKLNKEITATVQQFSKLQSRLRPIAKDMGVIAMASERLTNSLKSQRGGFETNIRAMQQYRSEMGRVARAQRALKPTVLPQPRTPRAPGGGGGGGRRGGGGGVSPDIVAGAFGVTLGNQIGNVMTDAIYRGFQLGTQLMMKPFQYFAGAFAERVGDELKDIQSAGGIFASDKKFGTGLFKDFAEARAYQEKLNQKLAVSAAALPGATSDYVKTARQLTDTISLAFSKNQKSFNAYAKELGGTGEALDSMAVVLQKFTEKGVLLGQGQTGGIPLPILLEQLISREKVNVQGLKTRFVALRDNPLLASALEDAQNQINQTGVGTAERIKAVMKALDAALPNEVISAMKRSLSGVQEAVRSAFIDPDTGLFGLSRELSITVPKIDEFGRYIKKNGQIASSAADAAQETTSVFKILRDTLAGFVLPLSELIAFLPEIFDPLAGVAEAFKGLRERANFFYNKFIVYTKFFEEEDKKLLKAGKQGYGKSKGARGALAAVNKLLEDIGAIKPEAAKANALALEDPSKQLGGIAKQLLSQLFSSDVMKQIGEALGSAIGSVLSALAAVLSGAKDMASAGPFAEGFSKGFNAAKGGDAIATIYSGIFGLIGKGILELFKAAPLQTTLLGGLLLFGPAIASAIGTAIVGMIPRLMGSAMTGAVGMARGAAGVQGPMASRAGAQGMMLGGFGGKALRTAGFGAKIGALTAVMEVAGTVADVLSYNQQISAAKTPEEKKRLATERGTAVAGGVGGAVGAVAGGALGAALGGPIGAMIGAQLGNAVGNAIGPSIGNWWNTSAWPALKGLGTMIGNFFSTVLPNWWRGTAWPAIQNAFNTLKSGLGSVFKILFAPQIFALNMIRGLAQNIFNTAKNFVPGIGKFFTDLPGKIGAAIKGMFGFGGGGGGIGRYPKTSGFGMRWGKMHQGNDYGMPVGTKLGVGGPSKLVGKGYWGGYGNAADFQVPGGTVLRFAHLDSLPMAPVGAVIPPGMLTMRSGNTGRSTGPHLHFEARPGGGGPVPPDAFANLIRANFVGSPFGPLMDSMSTEMKKMPYGAQLAVANSDEIFMKPKQMANVIEASTRAGAEGTGNITTGPITISIDGYNQDPKQLTETIAAELIGAMYRKSRSEVLTS